MDYDDNDFQNHNFQLVGEDNSRFPQSLQSFSLPKFDIDDNLQIQLRYDSLDETEALLGIQGQENNWLEEFSARHGATNFSSNAGGSCSMSMHNNVWSEATSSESVEMLLKSVGEDEMLNQNIINKDSDTLTMDDSTDCGVEIDMHNETTLATKCQNEDVVGMQKLDGHTSQKFKDGLPKNESDLSLLGEKTDSSGKVGTTPHGSDVKLKPSSDVIKEGLDDHVFLKMVQNVDPSDSTSALNNAFDQSGCAAKIDANRGPSSVDCSSSQDDPSDTLTENTNTVTGHMTKESFSGQRVESDDGMNAKLKPEILHPHNELNVGSHIYSAEGTVIDQHFKVHNANDDAGNATISSSFEPLTDSLVLLNERNSDSVFSPNSEGLLESIAYQVKLMNKDSGTENIVTSCSKEITSMAILNDVSAQKETAEVGDEDVNKFSRVTEESNEFSLVVPENLSDSLHPSGSLSTSTYITGSEEEREPATCQAVEVMQEPEVHLPTNICNELSSSSERVVDIPFSTVTTFETRTPAADNDIRAEPLNSTSPEPAMIEKNVDGCVTVVSDNSNDELGASDDSIINRTPTLDVKTSSSDICKSVPTAVNDNSNGELGASKDTIIMETPASDDKISSFSDVCKSPPMSDTEKLPAALSRTESTYLVMDDSSLKESTLGQPVVEEEAAAAAVSSSPASDSNKDANTLSLVGNNNLGTTDPPPPLEVPATVSSLTKNFPSEKESTGEECCAAGESSHGTCQDTNQGSKDNAGSVNIYPSQNATEADGGNCGSPTVISCRKCPQDEVECQEGNGVFSDFPCTASEIDSSDQVKCTGITSKDDSFTFEVQAVGDAPQKDIGKDLNPSSDMPLSEQPQISPVNSQVSQKRPRKGGKHSATSEMSDKGKMKQASSPAVRKTSNLKDKEKSQSKQGRGRGRNPSNMSPNPDKNLSKAQKEVIGQYSCPESSSMKSSDSPSIPTSSVPDKNASISPVALSHRPFTDLQQFQLRAQIFVYGSLIQGVPPDEACIMSAFGGTDGGRNLWGGAWRAASERFQNQKSPLNNYMTPLHPRSGTFNTEQTSNSKSMHDKNISSTVGKSAHKVISSAELNFAPSLSSPLWSTPSNDGLPSRSAHVEFHQSVSPLHPYQPTQATQYTSNATPWLSQSPHPASWVFPSHGTPFDTSAQYSTVPAAEKVQVTPVRDLPTPCSSSMQFSSPSSLLPHQSRVNVSSPLVSSTETQKKLLTSASTKKGSNAQESRKRKKVSTTEEPSVSQSQPEYSATISMQIPAPTAFGLFSNSPSVMLPPSIVSATPHPVTSTRFLSEETIMRVDQSKLQAENASACAAAAVSYSQGIWGQLATQRQSSMISEVEEKLASAAVAAAAAASVAKAAAEAAKVASEAALQAKMMADEAVDSIKIGSTVLNSETNLDVANNLSKLNPVSILKTKDKPSSVISAAREATRKRVEAASAAAKRAENLDAIMKAAELAAEAVSQAGTIIAMGDPLPFSLQELIEAGPEGYWKVHATKGNAREKTDGAQVQEKVDGDHVIRTIHLNDRNFEEKQKASDAEGRPTNNEQTMQLEENSEGRQSESALDNLPAADLATNFSSDNILGSIIQKGSLIEVSANKESLRGAWFSAWVLDLKDGKAYICYKDLLNEGREQLKEWIPLERDSDKAPRIRAAHPITVAKPEGTRKRRRDAVGTSAWEVGDRVDVWMRNGWWEGIVTEKSREDETKLNVHFPGTGGDASAVRAWNLRPSLIWQDGQWSKWTHDREKRTPRFYEGDSPVEKRQKIIRLESENIREMGGRALGNLPRANHMDEPMKLDESRQLSLAARDKIFSVGTTTKEENNTKTRRAGLQKGGSGVVIGVPKPGKRRKFMEVSKHYTTDKTDIVHEGSDSIKFTKYLMPQTSNLWRSTTRVDGRGKQGIDTKPRGPKSVRSKKTQARNTAEKDNMSAGTESAINSGESGLSSLPNLRTSINEESTLERKNLLDSAVLESGLQPISGVASLKQKSSVNEDTSGKGKFFPASDKLAKSEDRRFEDSGNMASEGTEPRRSNRRIQPTSRLLEGLQSSLIMSKIPSVSHDRSVKTSSRSVSSSRGHNHG